MCVCVCVCVCVRACVCVCVSCSHISYKTNILVRSWQWPLKCYSGCYRMKISYRILWNQFLAERSKK